MFVKPRGCLKLHRNGWREQLTRNKWGTKLSRSRAEGLSEGPARAVEGAHTVLRGSHLGHLLTVGGREGRREKWGVGQINQRL